MADRVLITGGIGFIGFFLAKLLLEKGFEVTIVDNLSRGQLDQDWQSIKQDVHFLQADLTDSFHKLNLNKSYTQVYHLAAVNGVKYATNEPDRVLRVNIMALMNVLEMCAEHPPETFVFASSSEVYNGASAYPDFRLPTPETTPLVFNDISLPRSSYAASKMIGEMLTVNYATRHHFKSRIVRFHNIYGPRMGFDHVIPEIIGRILKKQTPFALNGADQTRSFCYITDAVQALYALTEHYTLHPLTVNIGNQDEITIFELCEKLFRLSGYNAPILRLPPPAGSPMRRCPDISLLLQLTGYTPTVGLEEGLKHTLAWYRRDENTNNI